MDIKNVCVIGIGTMGSQIGIVFAKSGYKTFMVDQDDNAVEKGMAGVKQFIGYMDKKGKISADEGKDILARMEPSANKEEAFSNSDFIIEAVFENVEVKKRVFKEMSDYCKKGAILASNTSALSVTEIASVTSNPENCIGTHFLIPAALTPLVELVRAIQTSDEIHKKTVEFIKSCGKDTVTSGDGAGFIINRLYAPFMNEAFCLLQEGMATAEEIDKACVMGLGLPLGPLAAGDASGLEVLLATVEGIHEQLGEKYRPAKLLTQLVKAGHFGKKAGKGVYDYSKKK